MEVPEPNYKTITLVFATSWVLHLSCPQYSDRCDIPLNIKYFITMQEGESKTLLSLLNWGKNKTSETLINGYGAMQDCFPSSCKSNKMSAIHITLLNIPLVKKGLLVFICLTSEKHTTKKDINSREFIS